MITFYVKYSDHPCLPLFIVYLKIIFVVFIDTKRLCTSIITVLSHATKMGVPVARTSKQL